MRCPSCQADLTLLPGPRLGIERKRKHHTLEEPVVSEHETRGRQEALKTFALMEKALQSKFEYTCDVWGAKYSDCKKVETNTEYDQPGGVLLLNTASKEIYLNPKPKEEKLPKRPAINMDTSDDSDDEERERLASAAISLDTVQSMSASMAKSMEQEDK
eukprot:m.172798 g.172798  ORF g.172798 m.172798 type:complete len:159 (-) comp15376_c0_seq12:3023-3499(-)